MFILNVLIVDLHGGVIPLKEVEFASDRIQLRPEFVNTVIPVLLDLLDSDQLHLVVLHLVEHVLVKFLQPLALISILNPLIVGFIQGKLQMVLL